MTRMLACCLSFALFLAPEVGAQDAGSTTSAAKKKELPDAPKPNPTPFLMPVVGYRGPMPSHGFYHEGDDIHPRFGFRQVADQRYWTVAVALPAAASVFDAVTTLHAVSLGHLEANPLFGAPPTPGRIAGIKLGAAVLTSTCSYMLKRSDMRDDYEGVKREGFPGRWWVTTLVAPALWLGVGIHNATLHRVPPQVQGH